MKKLFSLFVVLSLVVIATPTVEAQVLMCGACCSGGVVWCSGGWQACGTYCYCAGMAGTGLAC